jgi:hypothetical protein
VAFRLVCFAGSEPTSPSSTRPMPSCSSSDAGLMICFVMSDHVIIDAAERFAKKPMPPQIDPPWTRTPEETRAMFAPSVKTLPFVSSEWKYDYWPDSMWADVPTDNHRADRERGKHFA